MKIDYRPKGFRAVTPGLSANGTPELVRFLERAFGAERRQCSTNPDGTIAHGVIALGDSIIELSEGRPEWPARPCAMHLYSADTDVMFARAVEAGAEVLMPLENTSYGDRAAAVLDPSGNHWYLATRLEQGPIPPGFHTLTPYLLARGAASVIDFMKAAFGASERIRVKNDDGSVMHAEVQIDDSIVEISDGGAKWTPKPCGLHLYVPDADAAYARAAASGASVLYAPRDTFYGDREAGVRDSAGNDWYIGTHVEDLSEEEMEHRRLAGQKA
jgi:uncharacterized glyoxalase superfamily protein PhnB